LILLTFSKDGEPTMSRSRQAHFFCLINFSLLTAVLRIRDVYPDFYPSRIPDPKTATKEKSEKKKFVDISFLEPQISQN
jgi:hypothetical protein